MNKQDRVRIDMIKEWLKEGVDPDEIKQELYNTVAADVDLALAELKQEKEKENKNKALAAARRLAAETFYNYLAARGIVGDGDPCKEIDLLVDMFKGLEQADERMGVGTAIPKVKRPAATNDDEVLDLFLKSLK